MDTLLENKLVTGASFVQWFNSHQSEAMIATNGRLKT